jgi:hypothetical protein
MFRNSDWVTPSREYAEGEGAEIPGGYRIIERVVNIKDVWWDANDINEFGYDDGKNYVYKNTKNNRKLNDVITRDSEGNIIPPSKRFNYREISTLFSAEEADSDPIGYLLSVIDMAPDAAVRDRLLNEIEALEKQFPPDTHNYPSLTDTPSNLTHAQWYAVRTDSFKEHHGDWEGFSYQEMKSNNWPDNFPDVITFFETEDKGGWKWLTEQEGYEAAKEGKNREAADKIVWRIFKEHPETLKKIEKLAIEHPDANLVAVFSEDSGNRIPIAFAARVSKITGLTLEEDIVQRKIIGINKRGSDNFYRLANRNIYDGKVERGREYILFDDAFAAGGATSELRRLIEQRGGKVIQIVTLASGKQGTKIALTQETIKGLLAKYNKKELNSFAKELDLGGGNFRALTEPEGKFILEQIQRGETLDSIRDRILESREKTARRGIPSMVRGTPAESRYNRPLNYIDPSEVTVSL